MMKSLLWIILACLPTLLVAQREADLGSPLTIPYRQAAPTSQKAVIDTIFPEIFTDTCVTNNLPVAFGINPDQGAGFVTGSNSFGDVAKLQRLTYRSDDPFLVTDVAALFAGADDGLEDTYVYAVVYEDLQPDSTFGNLVAISDSVLIRDLNPAGYTIFNFPDPPVMTSDSFLVGINFSDTYPETGDTTAFTGVASTENGCSTGNNSFEFFPAGDQLFWETIFENWGGLDIELYMAAVVNTDLNVSTTAALADYEARVFPNPFGNEVRLRFTGKSVGDYSATLTDAAGKQLLQSALGRASGDLFIEWDTEPLPAGLYLFHIDGPDGRQTGKLIKH